MWNGAPLKFRQFLLVKQFIFWPQWFITFKYETILMCQYSRVSREKQCGEHSFLHAAHATSVKLSCAAVSKL